MAAGGAAEGEAHLPEAAPFDGGRRQHEEGGQGKELEEVAEVAEEGAGVRRGAEAAAVGEGKKQLKNNDLRGFIGLRRKSGEEPGAETVKTFGSPHKRIRNDAGEMKYAAPADASKGSEVIMKKAIEEDKALEEEVLRRRERVRNLLNFTIILKDDPFVTENWMDLKVELHGHHEFLKQREGEVYMDWFRKANSACMKERAKGLDKKLEDFEVTVRREDAAAATGQDGGERMSLGMRLGRRGWAEAQMIPTRKRQRSLRIHPSAKHRTRKAGRESKPRNQTLSLPLAPKMRTSRFWRQRIYS